MKISHEEVSCIAVMSDGNGSQCGNMSVIKATLIRTV
jgi:hypothetical protein